MDREGGLREMPLVIGREGGDSHTTASHQPILLRLACLELGLSTWVGLPYSHPAGVCILMQSGLNFKLRFKKLSSTKNFTKFSYNYHYFISNFKIKIIINTSIIVLIIILMAQVGL